MAKGKSVLASTVAVGAIMVQGTLGNAQTTSNLVSGDVIRPFKVHFSDQELADLKQRILVTRWPAQEIVKDETQGVQLATMKALAKYWATDYDWRKIEAKINSYPQFITTIDGVDIHFIHVRSKNKNALP